MAMPQVASLEDAFERALGAILARVSASKGRIAIAYSGGLDSTALLHLAKAWAPPRGIELLAFHIHHGLSPHADDWMRLCERECVKLGVHFEARRVVLTDCGRDGVEQAARISRYAALGDLCRAHQVPLLLTAHHLDDQAETVLLQLLRGSGVAGLSGMEQVNTAPDLLGDGDLLIARPLLDITRADLEWYVREVGLPYVDDESNFDPRFARNALRHSVMPTLAKYFPGYQQRFARSAQHSATAQRMLDEVATQDMQTCAEGECIDINRLQQLSLDRVGNLLRHWLALRGVRMPSSAWLEEMQKQLLEAREDAQVRVIHADCEIRRHRGKIFLTPRIDDDSLTARTAHFRWNGESSIRFAAFHGSLHFDMADEGIAPAWLASQALQIRFRQGGERLKPAENRPTRSLKHHYQALNVPPWERLQLPVVLAGDYLLFAAGIGMNWSGEHTAKSPGIRLSWKKDSI